MVAAAAAASKCNELNATHLFAAAAATAIPTKATCCCRSISKTRQLCWADLWLAVLLLFAIVVVAAVLFSLSKEG